ncbi:ABC transporter permease [Fontivita pretiosa]|uniref:ABC transporter permease n=1 Tax=Fontivita pretiosa TaxID=2989684 RepID=UPI003D1760CC
MNHRTKILPLLQRTLIWLAIIFAWEAAYRTIGWKPWKFPAPSHVLDSLMAMLNRPTAFGDELRPGWPWVRQDGGEPRAVYRSPLITANLVSAARLSIGFVLSIALGAVIGLAMWRFASLDAFLGPVLLGLQTLPSVCWVPLAVLVFGINEVGVMFVLIMGSFSAIAIALRDGLRTMPPLYRRAGLMLGATGWKLYRYVLLPASLPAFAASLRQGFSFAWRSLLGAELIMAVELHGLGFLLAMGRDFADVAQVVAVMIVMVLIGMLADRWVFARLQQAVNARFGLS